MTSAAFTSLAAPALEDTMELSSSPAGNPFDDDIDIDYDEYIGDTVNLTDDERMLDDGDPPRPTTATDEMMDDDDNADATVVEEVMHDDFNNDQLEVADADIFDYDENFNEIDQTHPGDTTLQDTENSFAAPGEAAPPEAERGNEAAVLQLSDSAVAEANLEQAVSATEDAPAAGSEAHTQEVHSSEAQTVTETLLQGVAQADEAQPAGLPSAEEATVRGDAASDVGQTLLGEVDEGTGAPSFEESHGGDVPSTLKAPPHLPGTLEINNTYVSDGPPTPTDTGLPPMTISYGERSMPMFKSSTQPDGFLKNDNLAEVSLSDLMKNCRERLQVKLGEVVPEYCDVVLGFDRLGLVLVESHPSAFEACLKDVIEVWHQLHQNDGTDDVPPLCVTVTSQVKFPKALELLKHAAAQGQGMATLAPEHPSENEDLYQDEEEEAQADEGFDAQEHQEHQEVAAGEHEEFQQEYDAEAQQYTDENEHHEDYDGHEQQFAEEPSGENAYGEYPEDEYQEGTNYADFDAEEYPDPEGFDNDESATNVENTGASHDHENQPDPSKADLKDHTAETFGHDSAASSTTIHGDAVNEHTETYADDGQDDFSNLLDDALEHAGDPDEDAEHVLGAVEQVEDLLDPGQAADDDGGEASLNPGPADFLASDYDEAQDDLATALAAPGEGEEKEQVQDDPDEGLIQYDDEPLDRADYVDDTKQDGDEPGEDDEQFHTAVDLLDGDDTGEGFENPENIANTAGQETGEVNDEDDIGYDDDDYAQPEVNTQGIGNSPLGKRSFEELDDEDELDAEPEQKKARSD